MFRYLTLAIAFSFLSTAISVSENVSRGDKITVDVYYESLCPYSVDFVTKTLVPDYDFFKDFIRINFIPFGKAQYIIGNPTTFTCQHGPNECYGNRAQACALYEVQQTVKTENQQQRAIDVVGCVMGSDDPTNAVLECAAKTGFKKESIKNIRDCMSNDLGNALLVAYGDKTKEFESPLLGVPSVAINGVKDSEATSNFIGQICQHIPDTEKPSICKKKMHRTF